jgi:hypothetical protein
MKGTTSRLLKNECFSKLIGSQITLNYFKFKQEKRRLSDKVNVDTFWEIRSSESSAHVRTTRRYILEDGNVLNYRCENFKSYKVMTCLLSFIDMLIYKMSYIGNLCVQKYFHNGKVLQTIDLLVSTTCSHVLWSWGPAVCDAGSLTIACKNWKRQTRKLL